MNAASTWNRSSWTVGALALGVLLGCEDPYYSPCDSDPECPEGYSCMSFGGELACVPPCATDEDCAVVATHGDAYCTVVGGCAVACTADADCPPAATCDTSAGACVGRDR